MVMTTHGDAKDGGHEAALQAGAECHAAALVYLVKHNWAVLALCPPDHVGVRRVSRNHSAECKSPGKRPWHTWRKYQKDRPTQAEVRDWWRQMPNSNVGVALGPVSGIVRVDVDGAGGAQRFAELCGGEPPATCEFTSGGGGRGLLFAIPPGVTLRTTAEKGFAVHDELRIQAKGGQTVLPPSRHKDGPRYEWLPGRSPDEIRPAPMPPWMVDLMRVEPKKPSRSKATRSGGSDDKALMVAAVAALSAERAEDYDSWTQVGMAIHSVDPSEEGLALWDSWSKKCPEKYEEGKCAAKWATFDAGKENGIRLGSLLHWAKQDSGWTPRWAKLVWNGTGHTSDDDGTPADGSAPASAGASQQNFALGSLHLLPGMARRTPSGKATVQVKVTRDGEALLEFSLTSAASSWKNPARQLPQLAAEADPDGEEVKAEDVERLLMRIIADAGTRADEPPVREGPMVAEIVREKAVLMWRLVCRTERGAWSEVKPGEVSRSEFVNGVPEELMAECAKASDAPPSRYDLLRVIQAELAIVWATALAALPPQQDADLGADTAAGRQFRSEMAKLWTVPHTWEIPKRADGTPAEHIGATKASLVSRVHSQSLKSKQRGADAGMDRWQAIHPALLGWWRFVEGPDGEIKVCLAMRWELGNQVGQELTGVTDQESLTRLGIQFGVIRRNPDIPDRTTGSMPGEKQYRLAILTENLTEELLALPAEGCVDPADGDTVTA